MSEIEAQLKTADLATKDEYIKDMDELVNCKIVLGMKKAVQLIFDKFDILCQQKVKSMVKSEIDTRIKELKELARKIDVESNSIGIKSKISVQTSPIKKRLTPKRMKKYQLNKK